MLDRRGNIVIELIIAFPLLLSVLFLCLVHMQAQSLLVGMGAAAREGAREYAYGHSAESAVNAAEAVLEEYSVNRADISAYQQGAVCYVTVERPYQVSIPFIFDKTYQLSRTYSVHEEP